MHSYKSLRPIVSEFDGVHCNVKLIQRRAGRPSAYGFKNWLFNNYRLRVIAECG